MSKVMILHLSDLHFKVQHESIALIIAEKISLAVSTHIVRKMPMIIVVSGDLAFSGKKEQYEVFDKFISSIESRLVSLGKITELGFFAIPGNHDCDFDISSGSRRFILNSAGFSRDEGVFNDLANVQKNFWEYINKKSKGKLPSCPVHNFLYEFEGINFLGFNTSWTSQIHENQSKLRVNVKESIIDDVSGLVISVFHHPYNWIDASDAYEMKGIVESVSNIALSGHEHILDSYTKERQGSRTAYVEAGAVLENSAYSRFNVLIIDKEIEEIRIISHKIKNKDNFVTIEAAEEKYIGSLKNISRRLAVLNREFYQKTSTISAISLSSDIPLDSIFYYPNLEEINLSRTSKDPEFLSGNTVLDAISKHQRVIIHGEPNSGKSGFANKLYLDLFKTGMYPILFNYESHKALSFEEIIDRCIKEQYESLTYFEYMQIPREKRCVIIDNLASTYKGEVEHQFLLDFESNFNSVTLFTGIDPLDNLIRRISDNYTSLYSRYRIVGFGAQLRRKMIESFLEVTSGDKVEKDRDYYQKLNEIESAIDTSLRSKLISPYPIYIMGIIQHYIANNGKTVAGSNNFIYDLLVRTSLANISETDSDYLIYETFLSQLAYKMLEDDIYFMDSLDMHQFALEYIRLYKFKGVVNEKQLIETLIAARIMEFDGVYRFKHRHLIYYFSAINLKNYRSSPEQSHFVNEMIENLDSHAYLNTVAFMVYLNRDYKLVEDIMAISERETSALPVAEVKSLKETLNLKKNLIDDTIIQSFDRSQDIGIKDEINQERMAEDLEQYDPDKILTNLRILDLVGEIAKNHVGSWNGDEKAIVVEFCYKTSQKIVGHLYFQIDEMIKEIIANESKRADEITDPSDIAVLVGAKKFDMIALVNRSIYGLYEFLEVGITTRIANAVGTSKMREVYEEVLGSSLEPSAQLLNATILMNTSTFFPERKIITLNKALKNDEYHARMLKYLVRIHFMNYPTTQIIVNRVLGNLNDKSDKKAVMIKSILKKR